MELEDLDDLFEDLDIDNPTKDQLYKMYGIYLNDFVSSTLYFEGRKITVNNPLAELNKRIFKSANRFVVNVVYILKDCKCTYFP